MDGAILLVLIGIFLILAWAFILEPVIDGLAGFFRNLFKQLTNDNKEPPA